MPCIWGKHDRNQVFLDVKILSLEDVVHLRAGTGEKTLRPFKALVDKPIVHRFLSYLSSRSVF